MRYGRKNRGSNWAYQSYRAAVSHLPFVELFFLQFGNYCYINKMRDLSAAQCERMCALCSLRRSSHAIRWKCGRAGRNGEWNGPRSGCMEWDDPHPNRNKFWGETHLSTATIRNARVDCSPPFVVVQKTTLANSFSVLWPVMKTIARKYHN